MSPPRHGDTAHWGTLLPTWTWTPLFTSPLPSSSFLLFRDCQDCVCWTFEHYVLGILKNDHPCVLEINGVILTLAALEQIYFNLLIWCYSSAHSASLHTGRDLM